jgi:hypothetical protein
MLIRVNKNTGTRRPNVKYAALSTGTVSHVWYDEDSASSATPKRQNRIKMIRMKSDAASASTQYDA